MNSRRLSATVHPQRARSVALIVALCFAPAGAGEVGTAAPAKLAGGPYVITSNTVDAGGGVAAGDRYRVAGTFGQPDAGTLVGSTYALSGGFWTPDGPGSPLSELLSNGFE